MKQTVFAIVILFGLFSCQQNDSSPKSATKDVVPPSTGRNNGNQDRGGRNAGNGTTISQPDKSDYSIASCEFKFDQGEPAPSLVPEPSMYQSYFEKQIDTNLLYPLLNSSASETVRFAKLIGLSIYSVSAYEYNSCAMLSALPTAPYDYSVAFTNTGGNTLGLYLPAKNNFVKNMNETPVIMIRKDANRWVLVHEIMHHLYSKEVQSQINDDDLKAQLKPAIDKYVESTKQFAKLENFENGKKLVSDIKLVLDLFPEFLKRYMLEEITIEGSLSELLNEKLLTNIPSNQSINGAAYIYTNSQKADSFFSLLSGMVSEGEMAISKINSLALVAGQPESKVNPLLFKKYSNELQGYKETMVKLKTAAEKRLLAAGIDKSKLLGQFGFSGPSSHGHSGHGCARSKEADAYLEQLKSRF